MSPMLLYLAVGLPVVAMGMAAGALFLTKRSHDRFKEAILAEQATARSTGIG